MSRLDIKGFFFFFNKFCYLLIHASFTKFTDPAKLFLNYNIFYFLKNTLWFFGFLWWWSLQRGQLNKSPCGYKKRYKIQRKKLTNSIKLNPLSCPLITVVFIKRYTRSIFCDISLKIEQFLNLFQKEAWFSQTLYF